MTDPTKHHYINIIQTTISERVLLIGSKQLDIKHPSCFTKLPLAIDLFQSSNNDEFKDMNADEISAMDIERSELTEMGRWKFKMQMA